MKELLQRLQRSSSFNYLGYVERYNAFFSGKHYSSIISYWNKRNGDVPVESVAEFDWLYANYNVFLDELHRQVSSSRTNRLDVFQLLEYVADLKMVLDSVKNLPKYLRVSSNSVDVFEFPVEEYFVRQGDTLESIAYKFYGDVNRYVDIVDFNGISYYEVNNGSWVGRILKVPLVAKAKTAKLSGVVDGQIGKDVLGKDLKIKFEFSGNDIATVEKEDCFAQSMYVLINEVPRSSIPEFPTLGSTLASIIGKNIGPLSVNLVISDLIALFKSDPTFSSAKVTKVEFIDDKILLSIEFQSVLHNVKHDDSLSYVYRT